MVGREHKGNKTETRLWTSAVGKDQGQEIDWHAVVYHDGWWTRRISNTKTVTYICRKQK